MNYPERYELIICKVERIMNYGVIVRLEEYENVKGFVPLSQIATRWVKNIRNFVKQDQIRVGKVLYINKEKQQVDVSFAAVSDTLEAQKLNEWRQTKRVFQLIGILAKEQEKDPEQMWDEIVNPILEKYNTVFDAFKDIIIYGKDYVETIPENLRAPLHKILEKNIVIHEKEISEEVHVTTNNPDGVDKIKKMFANIPTDEHIKTSMAYIGSGKYFIKVKAIDYKKIEKHLKKINDYLTKEGKKMDVFDIKRLDK